MSTYPDNFICPITQDIMIDPVICSDGITYEKNAIIRWLVNNNTSPVTRQSIEKSNIIPNIALRNTIQDYLKSKNISLNHTTQHLQNMQNIQNIQNIQNVQRFNPPNITCDNSSFYYDNYYYSMLTLKFSNNKRPNMIFAVVDTSGSMGESADIPNSGESSGLSRLDLVKHTLNTFVHSLNPSDKICIIKFSNTASVISDIKFIDQTGKTDTLRCIERLEPEGMTNLWDGIKTCINKIKDNYDVNYNVSMIVMTDGVSNSDPPRGIIPSLTDLIRQNKLNFTINTFGYGYNIDSNLLENIANIGSGIFGFIPDASMVGTIFINMISNIINSTINNLTVSTLSEPQVELITPQNMGMIMINQPVNILYRSKSPFTIDTVIDLDNRQFHFESFSRVQKIPSDKDLEQYYRIVLIKTLKNAIDNISYENLMNLRQKLQTITQIEYIKDLIDDIYFDDPNKGQLYKALSKRVWFDQWGKHYLKSIVRAHELMKCITFKELSPQHYINEEFKLDQSRIEQIFCNIPAPIPSNRAQYYNASASYAYASAPASYTPVSMTTYYNQDGGCFDGYGMVTMYDPVEEKLYSKPVWQIKKSDIVYCPQNIEKYAIVDCVLKLKINKEIMLADINNMKITPFHPININNQWRFPINVVNPQKEYIDYVYDFVLDSGHVVEINNIHVITLGHKFDFNRVVSHEYFGDKIINDLKTHKDWDAGLIILDNYQFIRDDNMRVYKLTFN
jgi:hypothetical protein